MIEIIESLINEKRLNLISKVCGEASSLKIKEDFKKAFENSTKVLDTKTIEFINFISKIDNLSQLEPSEDNYDIGNRKVHIINSDSQVQKVIGELQNSKIVGFDSEQKPVFQKGVKPSKISIIQMANDKNCYIFQVQRIKDIKPILSILTSPNIVKVGIGLKGDSKSLFDEYRIRIKSCIDFGAFFKDKLYYPNDIGAKKATLFFLNKKLQKSAKATKSNWENKELSQSQIKYASEDATCVYDCFEQMIEKYPFLIELLPIWFKKAYEKEFFSSSEDTLK